MFYTSIKKVEIASLWSRRAKMRKIVVTFRDIYKEVHKISFIPEASHIEILDDLELNFGKGIEILDTEIVQE